MGFADYNPEMNRYMKDRYTRRRNEWLVKLGGACVECGTVEQLEFDHIDPRTKEYSIAKILSGGSEAKVAAEMAKCQLLCHEHHLNKSRADRLAGLTHKKKYAPVSSLPFKQTLTT